MRAAAQSVWGRGKNEGRWGKVAGTRGLNKAASRGRKGKQRGKQILSQSLNGPESCAVTCCCHCSSFSFSISKVQLHPSIHLLPLSLLSPMALCCAKTPNINFVCDKLRSTKIDRRSKLIDRYIKVMQSNKKKEKQIRFFFVPIKFQLV